MHSLKDTFHFVDSISNVEMYNTNMLSLDDSPLFTIVPLDETIKYLCEYIEKIDKQIGLPIPDLKQLLYFCTKTHNSYLTTKCIVQGTVMHWGHAEVPY